LLKPFALPPSPPGGPAGVRGASQKPNAPAEQQAPTEVEIVADNIRAAQILYFASALEEMRLFQVMDRIVDLFTQGMLPIGRGSAGNSLYQFWKLRAERLSAVERRGFYARVLGVPSGDATTEPMLNREFPDLWLRFLSAVAAYARQPDTGTNPRGGTRASQEGVRSTARELAVNLSRHGHGLAGFAAKDLQLEIQQIIQLLSDREISSAFGARDMWQVIETVAATHLGGAVNTTRHRVRSQSGSVILGWLANRGKPLLQPRPVDLLNDDIIRKKRKAAKGRETTEPTDYDLVNAIEQWLAVAGTPDDMVGRGA